MHNSAFYQTWRNMQKRCYDPTNPWYKYYGLKGVTICEEWRTYTSFKEKMLDTWFEGASIDRLDESGNYEPSNCKWILKEDQTTVGRQGLRYNNKTGAIGVEELRPGVFRVLVRERGWPRGKGPKHVLYHGTDFEAACQIRADWVAVESKILASSLKGSL